MFYWNSCLFSFSDVAVISLNATLPKKFELGGGGGVFFSGQFDRLSYITLTSMTVFMF